MAKNKDRQFFMENLKMNRKRTNKIMTYRSGDSNLRFSVIFIEGEGDPIKSKQASE